MRLVLFVLMVAIACGLAGAYGMVHNQISYTVGPDYFHALKFLQFRIPEPLHNRIGAALVGWRASWWMGLIIGLPIAALAVFIPGTRRALRSFLLAALLVIGVTLGLGLLSLLIPPPMDHIPVPSGARDPLAFGRAAVLHDASYTAGIIGLIVGLIFIGRRLVHARYRS